MLSALPSQSLDTMGSNSFVTWSSFCYYYLWAICIYSPVLLLYCELHFNGDKKAFPYWRTDSNIYNSSIQIGIYTGNKTARGLNCLPWAKHQWPLSCNESNLRRAKLSWTRIACSWISCSSNALIRICRLSNFAFMFCAFRLRILRVLLYVYNSFGICVKRIL